MRLRRLPWQYLLFAPLTMFGPLWLVWSSGSPIQPSTPGLVLFGVLLFGLARGSILAWTLLATWNAAMFGLMLLGAFTGSELLAVGRPVLFHGASLALLFSPTMRRHVGCGPPPPARPSPALSARF